MAAAPQFAPVKYAQVTLGAQAVQGGLIPGGLDLTTPALRLNPGAVRDMLNFEVSINGGYARIAGYERFDGQMAPSSAAYIIVQLDSMVNAPDVGSMITQVGSGAQGTVAGVYVYPTPYLVLTDVIGVFDDINSLTTLDSVSIIAGGQIVKAGGFYLAVGSVGTPIPPIADPTSNLILLYAGGFQVSAGGADLTVNTDLSTLPIWPVIAGGSPLVAAGAAIVLTANA